MEIKEKAAIPVSPAATDDGQSPSLRIKDSTPENQQNIDGENDLCKMPLLFRRVNSPDYLYTVSLTELYDTVYQPRAQVIGGLLCSGAYLFAGAPKVGKSFFMAQFGYYVTRAAAVTPEELSS